LNLLTISILIRFILLGNILASFSCFGEKVKESGRSFIVYCAPDLPASSKVTLKTQIQYFIAGGSGASNKPKWGMRPGDRLRICDGAKRVQIGETLHFPADARAPVLQTKVATGTKAFLVVLKASGGHGKSAVLNLPLILTGEVKATPISPLPGPLMSFLSGPKSNFLAMNGCWIEWVFHGKYPCGQPAESVSLWS
jgi:hypothetical protein